MQDKTGVLLIEKDRESRSYYNLALNASQYFNVHVSASAEEALEIIDSAKKGDIDIVIINSNIGEMNYYTFLQRLRSHLATFQANIVLFANEINPEDEFILKELGIKKILKQKIEANLLMTEITNLQKDILKIQNGITNLVYDFEFYVKTQNIEKCSEIIENDKVRNFIEKNPEFIYLLGEYHILKNDPQKTAHILSEFIHKNRGNKELSETVNILNCLGKALCLTGRHKEAAVIYRKMAEKSPKNLDHKINLSETHLAQGEWGEASLLLKQVLEIDPYNNKALINKAQAESGKGNYKEAETILEKIAGSVDYYTLSSYFNNRGIASTHEKNYQKASEFYKNALFFTKKHTGKVLFNLGLALYRNNKIEEAKEIFKKISQTEDSEYLKSSKRILKKINSEKNKN
jgi:Tfp pilus assembly protein PilF